MRTRRLVPVAAVSGAVIAVAALALSGCAAAVPDGYADARRPEAARDAPTTAPVPAARAAAPSATGGLVVTIGDSIMAGLGLDEDEAWPALLARDTGADIVNLSCSGAGFTIEGDCGDDLGGLVDEAIAMDPAVVIIQSSDNDLDAAQDEIDDATRAAVDRLRAGLPDARLIGIDTLWHIDDDEPDAIGWASDALQSALDADDGVFVSIGQPLRGRPDLLQWDGEHPTAEGQVVLADAVEAALDEAGITL